MCGIIIFKEKQKIKQKLLQQVERGLDSLGWVKFLNGEVQTFKTLWTIEHYLDEIEKQDFQELLPLHHRDASVGKVCLENAHPFVGKKFILFQNGTAKNFHFQYFLRYKKQVDSWNLLEYLEEHANTLEEIPELIQKLTQTTGDSFGIVYVTDSKNHLLYLDGARPSYFHIQENKLEGFANFCDEWNYGFTHIWHIIFRHCGEIVQTNISEFNREKFFSH